MTANHPSIPVFLTLKHLLLYTCRRIEFSMARGWESKSVEEQQAEMADKKKPKRTVLSAAQQKSNRKREGLELSRKRLSAQLESATRPEYREMLLESIAEIDKQLQSFE